MASDKAPNFAEGYEFPDAQKEVVEAVEAIEQGDLLKVTNTNAGGQHIVGKHTAATPCRYVALHDAEAGKKTVVLRQGTTKVTFGSDVTVGESCKAKAGKIVASGTAASSGLCGVIISNGNNDGDTGLIYFNGVMS